MQTQVFSVHFPKAQTTHATSLTAMPRPVSAPMSSGQTGCVLTATLNSAQTQNQTQTWTILAQQNQSNTHTHREMNSTLSH